MLMDLSGMIPNLQGSTPILGYRNKSVTRSESSRILVNLSSMTADVFWFFK